MFNTTLLIGCGGTGGHLAAPLTRLLSYHAAVPSGHSITFIDGDAFEDHNQQRQHAGVHQIGRNKAEWTAEHCQAQGLNAAARGEFLDKPLLRRLLRNAGTVLVVAAVDNDATRKLCIDTLMEGEREFVFISPGNAGAEDSSRAIKGNVLWFGQLRGEAIGLNPALVFPNIEVPQDAVPHHGSCALQAPSSPQLIAANALAAAYTLTVIQNLLDGALTPTASALFFNGRSFSTSAS